jgi:outer membrane protein
MKSLLSIIFTLALASLFSQTTVKIGYTNAEYIASLHPDYKIIAKQMQEYEQKLQMRMQNKENEFQQLQAEMEQLKSSGSDNLALSDKETQLRNKYEEIQNFQGLAQQQMMQKQNELMFPLTEKIQNSINNVGKANGYTHVFNGDALLWMLNAESFNITDKVLKELGISNTSAQNSAPSSTPSMLEVR